MFGEMTKKYVEAAIGSEFENAVKNWGETYNSNHEGYAVLKEEVDETNDELIQIKNKLYDCWTLVKLNRNGLYKQEVEKIKNHAESLALEACQIAAVCGKILNGL